ncbi:MAG: 50S ribosomal protein L7/L12 [Candidatus Magasanikbacteria bacterium]
MISEIEEMNAVELSELVEAIEGKFGVSAAAPAGAGGAAQGGSGGGSSSDANDVVITDPGQSKIQVVKKVKEITGKGLKESKSFVEDTPATVEEGLSESEAETLKEELEEKGAEVELQ